jgi:hypothetical protein
MRFLNPVLDLINTVVATVTSYLLQESGDAILLESGDNMLEE